MDLRHVKTRRIVGGTERKQGRQVCYISAAHPKEGKAVLDRKSWEPQLVPYVHHKWHTDTICGTDLVKVQEMGPIL